MIGSIWARRLAKVAGSQVGVVLAFGTFSVAIAKVAGRWANRAGASHIQGPLLVIASRTLWDAPALMIEVRGILTFLALCG